MQKPAREQGILFWLNYFGLVSWTSFWGGNFLLILIFGFSFGLWFMGNWVVDKPAKYVKKKDDAVAELAGAETHALPASNAVPVSDFKVSKTLELNDRPTVTDDTTRQLRRD